MLMYSTGKGSLPVKYLIHNLPHKVFLRGQFCDLRYKYSILCMHADRLQYYYYRKNRVKYFKDSTL